MFEGGEAWEVEILFAAFTQAFLQLTRLDTEGKLIQLCTSTTQHKHVKTQSPPASQQICPTGCILNLCL